MAQFNYKISNGVKPRILIFSLAYEPWIGGAELAVRYTTDRLFNYEFDLITCQLKSGPPKKEKVGNVNVYRVGFGGRLGKYLYPFFAARLANKLHRRAPYAVAWSIMAAYAGAATMLFLRRQPGVKFLLTLQEGDPIEHIHSRVRYVQGQWRKIFSRADHIQAISNFLAEWAKKEGAKCPIEVIPNGVDLDKFSAKGGSPPSPGFGRAGASGGETENELYTVVNFSDVKSAERMDAEFFGGRCEKVMKKCRAHSPEKLGEIATLKKGIEPGSEAYREGGKLFVRVSNLSKEGLTDNNQQFLSEKMYDEFKKDYQPKLGEILLSKDATPGIAYVVKEPIDGVTSGGIVKVKLKEQIDPEYVALCINSIVGQSQVERDAGGSIIKHWKPEQIKNLLIPILPVATQKKIADLVRESHAARKKAKELLEEAKRKVEEMIENF